MPKPGYNEKYAVFATRYGSVDSCFIVPGEKEVTEVPAGVAHFLEHKLFEKKEGNVFEKFAALGASVNAFTSYAMTAYLFSTTRNFPECLTALVRFVQSPYFTAESVAKEQGIIIQEIRMYEDNPERRVYDNLLKALYHRNPVRIEIAGTVDSVKKIDKDLLYRCYETFYSPDNMLLFAVGDIEPEATIQQVHEILTSLGRQPGGKIRRIYPSEPDSIRQNRVEVELSVARPICYMGFKDIEMKTGRELLHRQLTTSMLLQLLFGKSSALYARLYESGLIDDGFGARYNAEETFSYSLLGGTTPDPDRLQEEIMIGLKDAKENGITQEDFSRQKRKAMGSFLDAFNSLQFVANNFVSAYFRGNLLFSYLDVLQDIRLEDVQKRLEQHLTEEKMAISIVRPRQ